MFELINYILKDRSTETFSFKPFSLCHILYLLTIIGVIVALLFAFRKKSQEFKLKTVDVVVDIALGLYILDFFCMPLSQGEINIDKLPFHLCTLMSIMCFLSRHTKLFSKFKNTFTILGLVGALMYICYPAGVCNSSGDYFDGYTYRIIQTVLYHGVMVAQGVFAIAYGDIDLKWSGLKLDIIVVLGMIVWAMLGNSIYSATIQEACNCVEGCTEMITVYDVGPNWFFVENDALYIIPNDKDDVIAPIMMIVGITGMCALIRFLGLKLLSIFKKETPVQE